MNVIYVLHTSDQGCQIGFLKAKFQKKTNLNLVGLRKLIWLFGFFLAFLHSKIIYTKIKGPLSSFSYMLFCFAVTFSSNDVLLRVWCHNEWPCRHVKMALSLSITKALSNIFWWDTFYISATKSLGKKVHYSPSAYSNSMLRREAYKELFNVMSQLESPIPPPPTTPPPTPPPPPSILRNIHLHGGLCVWKGYVNMLMDGES